MKSVIWTIALALVLLVACGVEDAPQQVVPQPEPENPDPKPVPEVEKFYKERIDILYTAEGKQLYEQHNLDALK